MSNPYDPPNPEQRPDEPVGPPDQPAPPSPGGPAQHESSPYGPPPPGYAPGQQPGQAPRPYGGQQPGYAGPQQGYAGQPAPGAYGAPSQRPPTERKGLAITSLVLGIVALLGCWIPLLNIGSIIIGAAGLVVGIIALVQVSKGTAGGKVMAIVGSALSVLAITAAIVVNVFLVALVEQQGPEFQQELEQQLEELEEQGY